MGDRWDRLVYRVIALKHDTTKAWLLLVEDDGGNRVEEWFPKSQSNFEPGDDEVAIPRVAGAGQGARRRDPRLR